MILRRTLKVSEVTDDKLTLVHVIHKIELNRVNDVNIQLRTVDLLEKAVNAYLRLVSSTFAFVLFVVKFEFLYLSFRKPDIYRTYRNFSF